MKIRTSKRANRKGFTLIELLVVIAIIAALAGVGYPMLMSQLRRQYTSAATGNLKNISIAMQTFQQDNNSYPNDATAEILQPRADEDNFGPMSGSYSNDYMRQIALTQFTAFDEKNFWVGVIRTPKEPDGKTDNGKCLAKGECSFSYVLPADGGSMGPKAPLLMISTLDVLDPASVLFDPNSNMGEVAYALYQGGSVKEFKINEEGKLTGEQDLFPSESRKGGSSASKYKILEPEI